MGKNGPSFRNISLIPHTHFFQWKKENRILEKSTIIILLNLSTTIFQTPSFIDHCFWKRLQNKIFDKQLPFFSKKPKNIQDRSPLRINWALQETPTLSVFGLFLNYILISICQLKKSAAVSGQKVSTAAHRQLKSSGN